MTPQPGAMLQHAGIAVAGERFSTSYPHPMSDPQMPPTDQNRALHLLEVRDLQKVYGKRPVVRGVSFYVDRGEIVGLLGRNGAGKTTTFRMTVGLVRPDGGTVYFNGQDIARLPMYKRARLGLGYLSQEPSVFKFLSVEDNILAILEHHERDGAKARARLDELIGMFGL